MLTVHCKWSERWGLIKSMEAFGYYILSRTVIGKVYRYQFIKL